MQKVNKAYLYFLYKTTRHDYKKLEYPINYVHSKEEITCYYVKLKDELNRLYGDLQIESFTN